MKTIRRFAHLGGLEEMRLVQFFKSMVMASIVFVPVVCAADSSPKGQQAILVSSGAIESSESVLDECRKKFWMLRDTVLQQTCASIESHIQQMESRLELLCKDAGEKIYKSVNNVEGIYIYVPEKKPDKVFGYYHEDDRHWHNYMSPARGRHYTFYEMDSFRKDGVIDHRSYEVNPAAKLGEKIVESYKELAAPEASYGITWKHLTNEREQRQGLYGDELTVFDVKSKEVLATRKMYFYVVKDLINDASGQATIRTPGLREPYRFATCKNYNPGQDDSYIDLRQRHSYKFVSKVLQPKQMLGNVAVHVFDFARGSGQKKRECLSTSFGPGISLEYLQFSRTDVGDLRIEIKHTEDALICRGFLHPAGVRFRESGTFRFYDGTTVKFSDLMKGLPNAAIVHVYSLARGAGRKSGECLFPTFGPGITADDLHLSKSDEGGLRIQIKGTQDSLVCEHFFHPSRVKNFSKNIVVRFFDGAEHKLVDLFENLNRESGETPVVTDSGSKLHVIGVYEGNPPPGSDNSPWWSKCKGFPKGPADPECHRKFAGQYVQKIVKVNVNDVEHPIILALTSYESVLWEIKTANGVVIEKVILAGYNPQDITGIDIKVPREVYTHEASPCKENCFQGQGYFYSYKDSPARLKDITGKDPISFQGAYTGKEFWVPSTRQ